MKLPKLLTVLILSAAFGAFASGCEEPLSSGELSDCVSADVPRFDPDQVTLAIRGFYRQLESDPYESVLGLFRACPNPDPETAPDEDSDISADADPVPKPSASPRLGPLTSDLFRLLARRAAVLEPTAFNDILMHLLVDYRRDPRTRWAIERLIQETQTAVSCQLRERRNQHPVFIILDDTLKLLGAVEGVGLARGLWASRGNPLQTLRDFRELVNQVVLHLWPSKRQAFAAIGLGTLGGTVHAVLDVLATQKLDPAESLLVVQNEVLRELGSQLVDLRDELRAITPEAVMDDPERFRARLKDLESRLDKLERERVRLSAVAAPLAAAAAVAKEDVKEICDLMKENWKNRGEALSDKTPRP